MPTVQTTPSGSARGATIAMEPPGGVQGDGAPTRGRHRIHPGSPGTTAHADAERALARVAAVLRVGIVIGCSLGATGALSSATNKAGYLAVAAAGLITSVWLVASVLRSGTLLGRSWRYADIAVALIAMLAMRFVLPPADLLMSANNWAPGYSTNAMAVAAVWLPSLAAALAVSGVFALTYAVSVAPSPAATPSAVLSHISIYLVFAVCVAVFSAALRRMATRADAAHEAAIAATRAMELDRYRILVHDATGILRQLGDERTPVVARPALRRQALAEAVRLRNYLSDDAPTSRPSARDTTLGQVIEDATAEFTDLAMELNADLGAGAILEETLALTLGRALSTVLHNVRHHAAATTVYVHADCRDVQWEVVVRDDGIGFDPTTTALGFGLSVQVIQALADCGASAHIESRPAIGTTVTLSGPVRP